MGALFGIIVIVAALIYVPRKLWSEAKQDTKDMWKQAFPFLGLIFGVPIIIALIIAGLYEDGHYLFILEMLPLTVFSIIMIGIFVWGNKSEDPKKKAQERQETINIRTENFRKDLVLPSIAAEVLAKQYRPYASNYTFQDAYKFVNEKFSSYFINCPKELIAEVIGFNEDYIPEGTQRNRRIAIVEIIVEKFGLRFHLDHSEIYGLNYSEIGQIRKLIDSYYQDVIKFDPSLITADTICYNGNPLNRNAYKFKKALKTHGYDVHPECYELFEIERNKDPDDISGPEIYQWMSRKASDKTSYYADHDFERELGIIKKDLPEEYSFMQREFVLRILCVEKLGLRYLDDSSKDFIKENKESLEKFKAYVKTHYSDILHEKAPRIYPEESNKTNIDPKLIYKRLSAVKALKSEGYDLAPEVFEFIKKESTSVWGYPYDFYNVSTEYAEKILLYNDADFERELGITCKDLPDHYWDEFKQSVLRRLCMQKIGLDYFKIRTGNENEWVKCREYIITNYSDILFERAPRIKL